MIRVAAFVARLGPPSRESFPPRRRYGLVSGQLPGFLVSCSRGHQVLDRESVRCLWSQQPERRLSHVVGQVRVVHAEHCDRRIRQNYCCVKRKENPAPDTEAG